MASNSSRKLLVKEIQRLRKNVIRRFTNIKRKYGESPALASWEKANLDTNIKGKSNKELQNLLSNLRYYNSLKTSSIKGVENYKKKFEHIEAALNQYKTADGSNPVKKKFYELYNKFVEENHLIDKYKYEVMELINNMMAFGESDEDIRDEVENLYNQLYAQEQGIQSTNKETSLSYADTARIFK